MLALSFALAFALSATEPSPISVDCSFDHAAMLALDYRLFDQDMRGGWRTLAHKGCNKEAADLIRDWREHHKDSKYILFWHEGQMRAFDGDYETAIGLFEKSRRPKEADQIGWNFYVDGSEAFLRGDLMQLTAARENLAKVEKPLDWDAMRGAGGRLLNLAWPVNLDVLDGFIRCWGKRYKDAYGCPR